ncbi:MAG TPA: rhodanese-like domain-containing protein [Thermoanaerobaculia bacterium]|nr:rhodanese-like domain-containing protein [Thermoanaerobaculia bacterium]
MSSNPSSARNAYIVMIVGGIAVLALVAWALMRSFSAPSTPNIPETSAAAQPVTPPPSGEPNAQDAEHAAVPRISVDDLKQKIARNEVTVIDVRDADSYMAAHIPGSLHIPLARIEGEVPYLPKAKPIVTYCT